MTKLDEAVQTGNLYRGLGIAMPYFIRDLASHGELRRRNRETPPARGLRPSGKSKWSQIGRAHV